MEVNRGVLGVVDYIIFGLMLSISAGIGVYFRFSGGKQRTTEEYLMAGRNMSILPVTLSVMASFLSAITLIGVPAETYRFGIHMVYLCLGYVIGITISGLVTLPVFFQLQAPSAYEYLERRFGKYARTITSVGFIIQMILYMSVVLYAPALALSAVTNMSMWVAIVSIGVVCTFYCTLGGMKAVLWTDVFQSVLMFIAIFAVITKGLMDMGISKVYNTAYDGGRLAFPGLELDFKVRYTIWSHLFHGTVSTFFSYGGSQLQIQRLMTVKDLSRAKLALYLSIPMTCLFHVLACVAGVIIYAYYADCDPMSAPGSPLSSADQLMPYYMMSTLGQYPGLPGLCICGVFSASLSTLSSAVNSLTAVTMQDFIKPFLEARGRSLDKMAWSAKILSVFFGFLCVALTFVVAAFGNLIEAGFIIYALVGAPVLGILILGMTTTRTNEKGAVIGLFAGVAISAWISFGAAAYGPPRQWLPVSTEGCSVPNSTLNEIRDSSTMASSLVRSSESPLLNSTFDGDLKDDIFILYRISFLWISTIGFFSTIIIGYIASLLTNLFNGQRADIPDELLSPFGKCFWKAKEKLQVEKEINTENSMKLEERPKHSEINGVPDIKEQSLKVFVTEHCENGIPEIHKQNEFPTNAEHRQNGVQNVKGQSVFSEINQNERF